MATCAWCGEAVPVRQTVIGKPGLLVLHRWCVPAWVTCQEQEEAPMGEQQHPDHPQGGPPGQEDKPDKPDKPEQPHGGSPGQTGEHPEQPHGGPPGQEPRPEQPIVLPAAEEEDDEAQPKE